jgi:peptide/nickel transport system permease protein
MSGVGLDSGSVVNPTIASSLIDDIAPARSATKDALRRFRRNKPAMISVAFLILLVLAAIFAPVICKYSPTKTNPKVRLTRPFDSEHWLGTDKVGRDVFAQIIYGARISLRVGFIVSISAAIIGTIVGSISGYFGGWVDAIVMRLVDMSLAIPYTILTVATIAVIGRGINAVIIGLALTGWFIDARVVRASFLSLKEQEFVQAARALGYKSKRIMFRHILPNALQPLIVYATLGVGGAILAEAALSFLGVGIRPPEPAWGVLIFQSKGELGENSYLVFAPGLAIFLVVLAFTLVGDGLRDALDPKMSL